MAAGILPGPSFSQTSSKFERMLEQAFELHRQQQYRRSIPLLEQARELRPRDYRVNLLLGIDTLRFGNPTKALTFLTVAHDVRPGDADALGYMAEAYAALQQFDRTAEALHLAAATPEAPVQARLALIQFCLRRFRTVEEELRQTQNGLAYAYRLQAMSMRDRKDPQEQEALLRVRALTPNSPALDSAFGHVALVQGRFDEAEKLFSQARAKDPHDLGMKVGEAILAVRANDLPRAESLLSEVKSCSKHQFDRAVREWPNTVTLTSEFKRHLSELQSSEKGNISASSLEDLFRQQCWESLVEALSVKAKTPEESFWLGSAHSQLDRYGEAIPPLERARVEPRFKLEANYWLSLCYARQAERLTERLPKQGPDSSLRHVVQGEVSLLLASDGPTAVSEYRKAVDAFPRDPSVWTGLAAAQLLNGDSEKARDSARKALQLDSGRLAAARIFAEASLQQRDYAAAISPLRQILQAQPDDPGAKFLLGTAYSKTGEDRMALPLLELVLHHGYPDEKGSAHYLLGTVLSRLGREKDAQQAFERSKELSDAYVQVSHSPSRKD